MTPERRAAWGIPQGEFTGLQTLLGAAEGALEKAENRAERNHVITVMARDAFAALIAAMRSFRRRYFTMPPLDAEDWAALGFRSRGSRGPAAPPGGAPRVILGYPGGPHVLAALLGPLAGTEGPRPAGDYRYAVYVGIMPQGGATLEEAASKKRYLMRPPRDGDELLHRRSTHRRKTRLLFDAEDAGKTAYACARYENGKGDAGPWGPVVSAIIP
jgi:hypothetical protein